MPESRSGLRAVVENKVRTVAARAVVTGFDMRLWSLMPNVFVRRIRAVRGQIVVGDWRMQVTDDTSV